MAEPPFRTRALHRQRTSRRKPVRVLNDTELAERLGVSVAQVADRLTELGWPFHRDSAGRLWATQRELVPRPEGSGSDSGSDEIR